MTVSVTFLSLHVSSRLQVGISADMRSKVMRQLHVCVLAVFPEKYSVELLLCVKEFVPY